MRRIQRLPGLPSSNLGLEALTGRLDEFDFPAFLGSPAEPEQQPVDVHSAMETRLKLGTKPATRGI